MRRLGVLLFAFAVLAMMGCSSSTETIKSHAVDDAPTAIKQTETLVADSHFDQGKRLYFTGDYYQATKHFIRSIATNRMNWQAHYYLGLCQQKTGRFDRAIGSFNNSLKFCPSDDDVIARINYALGISWENEGYLHKARAKYGYAFKLNPTLMEAKAGMDRVEAKVTQAEAAKAQKEKAY